MAPPTCTDLDGLACRAWQCAERHTCDNKSLRLSPRALHSRLTSMVYITRSAKLGHQTTKWKPSASGCVFLNLVSLVSSKGSRQTLQPLSTATMSTPVVHTAIDFYSKKAKNEGRNCFLWMTGGASTVIMSWRVTDLEPMKIRDLYRYVNIAWRETCLDAYLEPNLLEIYLCQVCAEPMKQVLDYNVTPIGPVFDSESEELVAPGSHFGLCTSDGSIHNEYTRTLKLEHSRTFDSLRAYFLRQNPSLKTMTTMPSEIREAVLRRDHRTCCITGLLLTEVEAAVEWIIPPALIYELEITSEERYEVWREVADGTTDPAQYERLKFAGNAITMHRGLAMMYKRNQLSVDVVDKYRIICFNAPKNLGLTLQGSLTINDHSNDRLDNRYLQRHFQRCILECMIGGGIRDDYNYNTVKSIVSLGISEGSDSDTEDDECWPDDKNGRLIQAWMTQYGN
ncbi:hypothetical protein D9615_000881 [Tricholomella constricta]|uniref:HNH nuclease domain-containing protein n=1 Tax=Tricholomella constricta TaxID=117010 RepID=A0A8H5HK17_9AGAR|nr:hypothetical protein D9615_000881 [Tricholomella constricta]